jgi:hypothetical protein
MRPALILQKPMIMSHEYQSIVVNAPSTMAISPRTSKRKSVRKYALEASAANMALSSFGCLDIRRTASFGGDAIDSTRGRLPLGHLRGRNVEQRMPCWLRIHRGSPRVRLIYRDCFDLGAGLGKGAVELLAGKGDPGVLVNEGAPQLACVDRARHRLDHRHRFYLRVWVTALRVEMLLLSPPVQSGRRCRSVWGTRHYTHAHREEDPVAERELVPVLDHSSWLTDSLRCNPEEASECKKSRSIPAGAGNGVGIVYVAGEGGPSAKNFGTGGSIQILLP